MKRLLPLLLISSIANAEENTGFNYGGASKQDQKYASYRYFDPIRFGADLSYIEQGQTKLYAAGLNLGINVFNTSMLDMFITGTANYGVSESPKVVMPDCPQPLKPTHAPVNHDFSSEQDPDVKKAKEQVADAKEKALNSQDEYTYNINVNNYNICKANKQAAEGTSRYGHVAFYEAGLESKIKLGVLVIGGFAGRRYEGSHNMNKGDLQLNQDLVRGYVGFEW